MNKKRNKINLKRMEFDDYIWICLCRFLRKEGHLVEIENGIQLKDGVEYPIINTPNRNKTQVPNTLWSTLLYKHVNPFHYN